MFYNIMAVDFDGTLCENCFPTIGRPKEDVINFCKMRKKQGWKLILWTCRAEKKLNEAVEWCGKHGLYFDAVNDNIPEIVDKFGGSNPRKITATEYLDDRNLNITTVIRAVQTASVIDSVKECCNCGGDTIVIDSRVDIQIGTIRRVRACKKCGRRFVTLELREMEVDNHDKNI